MIQFKLIIGHSTMVLGWIPALHGCSDSVKLVFHLKPVLFEMDLLTFTLRARGVCGGCDLSRHHGSCDLKQLSNTIRPRAKWRAALRLLNLSSSPCCSPFGPTISISKERNRWR